jgi:hypothetical protein
MERCISALGIDQLTTIAEEVCGAGRKKEGSVKGGTPQHKNMRLQKHMRQSIIRMAMRF